MSRLPIDYASLPSGIVLYCPTDCEGTLTMDFDTGTLKLDFVTICDAVQHAMKWGSLQNALEQSTECPRACTILGICIGTIVLNDCNHVS